MLSSERECSTSNKLGCEVLELEEGAEGVVLECSSSALPTGCVTLHDRNMNLIYIGIKEQGICRYIPK